MKATTINCKTCGRSFIAYDPRRMYCSAKCNAKARYKRNNPKDWAVDKPCKQCSSMFKPKKRRQRFCSNKCKHDWTNTHREYKHICKGCGVPFTSRQAEQDYCSIGCAVMHNVPLKILVCVDCGVTFKFRGRTTKQRCDVCHKRYWNDYYADAMAARGTTGWKANPMYTRKKRCMSALQRAGYRDIANKYWGCKCVICNAVKCGKRSIDVHHVDGDLENTTPMNLISLCRKCHARVHSTARNNTFAITVSKDRLIAALFELWPKGRQEIGIVAQRWANDNAANSVNAKLVTGLANAELGVKKLTLSVETIHGTPLVGEDIVQTINHKCDGT